MAEKVISPMVETDFSGLIFWLCATDILGKHAGIHIRPRQSADRVRGQVNKIRSAKIDLKYKVRSDAVFSPCESEA